MCMVFYIKSLKSGVHFLYTAHLNSDQSHFKCSLIQVDTVLESIELESYDHRELNLIWTDRYVFSLLKLRQGGQ